MRALNYSKYGGPDVLEVGTLNVPEPGPGEVLLRVVGAGLNPVDAKIRGGAMAGLFDVTFPIIPGWDVSGVVESIGEGVDPMVQGRKAYAYARKETFESGTCAQYCVVPEAFICDAPTSMDLLDACTVPLVALTAHQSIIAEGEAKAGDSVLVLAGAGAVGHYAIQMAHGLGAHTIATARESDHAALIALGADACVDYRADDWAAQALSHAPNGFNVILDAVGGATLEQCYDLVGEGGRLIGLNDPPSDDQLAAKNGKAIRLFSMPNGEQLQAITQQIDSGALKTLPVTHMELSEGAKAHDMLDKGARAKIALKI